MPVLSSFYGDDTLFHQSEGRLRQEFDLFSSVGLLGRAWLRGAAGRCRPQGSLSQAFFGSAEIERLTAEETLTALFDDGCHRVSVDAITLATSFERISLIPANHTLAAHNSPSPELAGLKQQTLRAHLEPSPRYDVVLIDCPPNLYLCSWTAMLAATRKAQRFSQTAIEPPTKGSDSEADVLLLLLLTVSC
jgi:hypothetical protein